MNDCTVKSVFKGEENRAGRYTRIWITLINQMERNKRVLAARSGEPLSP